MTWPSAPKFSDIELDVIQPASAMALLRYHERHLLRRFALFAAAATVHFTAKGISS
jgi:hypothetical protein